MTSLRHLSWFMALGIFWGVSPSVYKHLSDVAMPLSHTIAVTGLAVGLAMYLISVLKTGVWRVPAEINRYGAMCALLMNIPFGVNLYLAGFVPPTELAIIISLSPFVNYLLALSTGWESAATRRLVAIALGFASTVALILSRDGMVSGQISWWLISSLSIPILYCAYNSYAARAWPSDTNVLVVGAMESLWSGALALPLVVWAAYSTGDYGPAWSQYWVLGATSVMWVVERFAYFTLISEKGAVYTVQATYISTPAAVIIAAVFFGGVSDSWLWVSLALLMVALYLNNSGQVSGGRVPPAQNSPLDQHHA